MNILNLFSKIMGFIVIIITLALAPAINTANTVISGHANVTDMMGMSAVAAFGAPLIILGLLVSGGIFAVAGVKGQLTAGAADLFSVIGAVIVVIISLTLMDTVMDYCTTLMAASTGFAVTLYSIIPIILYIGIIASAGWVTVSRYRKARKGRGKAAKSYV